jgi:hypothetical protein
LDVADALYYILYEQNTGSLLLYYNLFIPPHVRYGLYRGGEAKGEREDKLVIYTNI